MFKASFIFLQLDNSSSKKFANEFLTPPHVMNAVQGSMKGYTLIEPSVYFINSKCISPKKKQNGEKVSNF